MTLRIATLTAASVALIAFASSAAAFPPLRPFVPPRNIGFLPNRPVIPFQQTFRPTNIRATIGPTSVPVTVPTVPAAWSAYYQTLRNYDRAVRHLDRAIIRYDLHHGINPFINSPYANPYGFYPYAYNPAAFSGNYTNPYLSNPYASNPYASNPYAYNPYMTSSYPYGGGSYGGSYGGGSYGGSYGGSGYGAPDTGGAAENAYGSPPSAGYGSGKSSAYGYKSSGTDAAATKKTANALTAFGIPNDGNDVQWPLALRVLLPKPLREVREKLDAQLQIITMQAVIGKANPLLVKEATKSVEQLYDWLQSRRDNMAEGTFRDADEFLRRLDKSLAAIKAY